MGQTTTARSQRLYPHGPVMQGTAGSDDPAIDLAGFADHVDPLAADVARQLRRIRTVGAQEQGAALLDLRRTVHELGRAVDQAAGGWPPPTAPDEAP